MATSAFTTGNKRYHHAIRVGATEVIFYFEVSMSDEAIDAFAKMLGIIHEVEKFFACVVILDNAMPRTFIAYEEASTGEVKEMFNISAGISPVMLLGESIKKGELG